MIIPAIAESEPSKQVKRLAQSFWLLSVAVSGSQTTCGQINLYDRIPNSGYPVIPINPSLFTTLQVGDTDASTDHYSPCRFSGVEVRQITQNRYSDHCLGLVLA